MAVQFCMPHQVAPLAGQRTLNFTMFEATPAPRLWAEAARRHDLTVLPTGSSLEAWLAGGAPGERLRLCPLGVDAERFRPGVAPLDLVDRPGRPVRDYRVRVLNVSEVSARKNLLGLLRVWLRATRADDDAILVVKLAAADPLRLVKLLRDLRLLERAIGKSRDRAASVLLFNDTLGDEKMPRLYATATHYWSMSCGEGWDQPMTEAGASGLRLIAPDHSAYRAYLDPTVATLIPSRRVPVRCPHDPWIQALFDGAAWWQPGEDAAADILVRAIGGDGAPALSARERLATGFSWERATARLIEVLDELEAGRGR
jgi:glycosyltransferase involved in cell wall biosynthesis